MRKGDRKGNQQNVVIKREEVVEGEGHGGAWKVAYADFVTAMMAFFLLMWLLNATTEDQRKGLADYFSPSNQLSHASSGTGDPFGGHTAFDDGALVSDRGAVQAVDGSRPTSIDPTDPDAQPYAAQHGELDDDQDQGAPRTVPPPSAGSPTSPPQAALPPASPPVALSAAVLGAAGPAPAVGKAPAPGMTVAGASLPADSNAPGARPLLRTASPGTAGAVVVARGPTEAELRDAQERKEKAEFAQAAQQIRDAVRADPALAELAHQLVIDMTPEGLRIQILDEERQPMFLLGSAAPNERAKLLLQKVTPVLVKLSQDISIAGHTDSVQFPGPDRTNWELSTERANATRRLLVEGGLPEHRVRSVTGNADRDPLVPSDPLAAANRRIAIVVLRAARAAEIAPPAGTAPGTAAGNASGTGSGTGSGTAPGTAAGAAPGIAAGPARGMAPGTVPAFGGIPAPAR